MSIATRLGKDSLTGVAREILRRTLPILLKMTRQLFFLERSAFARDEDGGGRLDVELFGVVALVDGDAYAVARIDEQEQIANGDIHKSLLIRHGHRFLVDLDPEFVAEIVAELFEFFAGNIRDQGAEGIVERDDVTGDALLAGGGCFRSKADELGNLGADKIEIPSGGEVRARRRKNVAPMKSGRNRGLNHPVWVGDFSRGIQAVAIHHRGNQAIGRKNKIL